MTQNRLIPTRVSILGSVCTGTDGTVDRTYVILDNNVFSIINIVVNGTSLMAGAGNDYTFTGTTVTFLNIIDDTDIIQIDYYVTTPVEDVGMGTTATLIRFLHLTKTIPNNVETNRELVGIGDSSAAVFWLDHLGVLENTYTLSYGASETSLTNLTPSTDVTEGGTSHYVIDLDISKVTLTSAGVTAVGTNKIYAEYKWNSLGLLNSELLAALNAAINSIKLDTGQTFADSTDTSPDYREVVNEILKGHSNTYQKVYDFFYDPVVKIHTTTNGDFTLTGTTLTLTDATLLPDTGTIYVGGNKVAYTAKEGNDLTVPNTTPSIDDGATVRGEVIELSMESEGTAPSYVVLDPDTEYEMDYDEGRFKILSNAYYSEADAETTIFPQNYVIRVSYMHAWHESGKNPCIPDDIKYVVAAIAARNLMGAVVAKAHETGLDGFNPSLIEVDSKRIKEILEEYTPLNVGTSPYNRQSLS